MPLSDLIPPFVPHVSSIVQSIIRHGRILNENQTLIPHFKHRARTEWDSVTDAPLARETGSKSTGSVHLCGVHHALSESSERVLNALNRLQPTGVALELDPPRFAHLMQLAGFLATDRASNRISKPPLHIRLATSPAHRRIYKKTGYFPTSEFLAALPPRLTDPAAIPPLDRDLALIDIPIDHLVLPIFYPPPPPPTPENVKERKREMTKAAIEGPLPSDQAMYTHLPLARSRSEAARLRKELEERVEGLRAYLGALREAYGIPDERDFEPPGPGFWTKWIRVRTLLREELLSQANAEELVRIDLAWPSFPLSDLCTDFVVPAAMHECEEVRSTCH